jgi:hypothetical protein
MAGFKERDLVAGLRHSTKRQQAAAFQITLLASTMRLELASDGELRTANNRMMA